MQAQLHKVIPMKTWHTARFAAGSLLIAAGLAKGFQSSTTPFLFENPFIFVALIQLELLFGVALILNVFANVTRTGALVLFGCFAIANIYLIGDKSSSCNCLGAISLSPWLMLGADIVVITLLWFSKPMVAVSQNVSEPRLGWPAWSILFIAICVFMAARTIHSIKVAPLSASRSVTSGAFDRNTLKQIVIPIANHSSRDVRITGITASCGIRIADVSPRKMLPRDTCNVTLELNSGENVGEFSVQLRLFFDHPEMTSLPFVVSGSVR